VKAYQSIETPLGQFLRSSPDFDRSGNYYEADLGASWELDVFGGLRRGRQAARADYQASAAGAVATQLAVAAQTADVYVTIRGLQARIAIAREQAETRRQLLSIVKLAIRQRNSRRAADAPGRRVAGAGRRRRFRFWTRGSTRR
jgi:outer membrane protein TolC